MAGDAYGVVLAFLMLSDEHRWTDALNAVLAWGASMTHVWAAVNTSGWLRRMFMGISALALLYSFSYWWLFFNPGRVSEWSNFLRPFGILTWVVAWSLEPVVLVLYLRRQGYRIVRMASDAVETHARETR